MSVRRLTGINIQYPISRDILSGKKTVETRTYPIPEKYLAQPMLIVETPGKYGKFKSRIVGEIVFTKSFLYPSKKAFELDVKRHLVTPDSPWAWKEKPKWGWEIGYVAICSTPVPVKRIGIRYTLDMRCPSEMREVYRSPKWDKP